MTIVLTQSSAIVKLDYLTTVSIVVGENNQYLIVADQYILGSYNDEETARNIISWMAHSIGDCTDNNLCITMPIVLSQKEEDNIDAEND